MAGRRMTVPHGGPQDSADARCPQTSSSTCRAARTAAVHETLISPDALRRPRCPRHPAAVGLRPLPRAARGRTPSRGTRQAAPTLTAAMEGFLPSPAGGCVTSAPRKMTGCWNTGGLRRGAGASGRGSDAAGTLVGLAPSRRVTRVPWSCPHGPRRPHGPRQATRPLPATRPPPGHTAPAGHTAHDRPHGPRPATRPPLHAPVDSAPPSAWSCSPGEHLVATLPELAEPLPASRCSASSQAPRCHGNHTPLCKVTSDV